MPWTWIRPADGRLLRRRPLLDLGTGDGQTLAALTRPERHQGGSGLVVGVDHDREALRAASRGATASLIAAEATKLPFRAGSFGAALAADVFHHLDDTEMALVLGELRRVLAPAATLVAWWYAAAGRPGPGSPRYPRAAAHVLAAVRDAGFTDAAELELVVTLSPAPATAGVVATNR